jgi:hypothetical protein
VVIRQARIDAELNNTAWRVRPEEVLVEVGTGIGASPALHSINEVLKVRPIEMARRLTSLELLMRDSFVLFRHSTYMNYIVHLQ